MQIVLRSLKTFEAVYYYQNMTVNPICPVCGEEKPCECDEQEGEPDTEQMFSFCVDGLLARDFIKGYKPQLDKLQS
jgi:hypothetical protein